MAPTSDSDESENHEHHQRQQGRSRQERRSLSPTPAEEKSQEPAESHQTTPQSWADDVDDTVKPRNRSTTKSATNTAKAVPMTVDKEVTATSSRQVALAAEAQDGWKTTRARGKKKKGKATRSDPNDPTVMQEAIVGITVVGGSGKKATIEEGGTVRIHPSTMPRQLATNNNLQANLPLRPSSGQYVSVASKNRFAALQSAVEEGDNGSPPSQSACQPSYKGNAFEQELRRSGFEVRENYINLEANRQQQNTDATDEASSNFHRNLATVFDICRRKGIDEEKTSALIDHALAELSRSPEETSWEEFILAHIPEGDVDHTMRSRGAKRLGDDLGSQKEPVRPRTNDDDAWADQEEMDVESDNDRAEDAEDELEDGEIVEQTQKPPTPL
ncbi:hypothetical protein HDU96_002281, partial [Phlyctochytrium bullatum]